MHLLPILQAADKREIPALRLRLALEKDPPALGQEIIQGAVRDIAV